MLDISYCTSKNDISTLYIEDQSGLGIPSKFSYKIGLSNGSIIKAKRSVMFSNPSNDFFGQLLDVSTAQQIFQLPTNIANKL